MTYVLIILLYISGMVVCGLVKWSVIVKFHMARLSFLMTVYLNVLTRTVVMSVTSVVSLPLLTSEIRLTNAVDVRIGLR